MKSLRKLFRSSYPEIWRQLAEELGARYVAGGRWKGDRIEASHGEWTLTLDACTVMAGNVPVTFTRLRAPYVNPDGFRFSIQRRNFLSGLAAALGLQDVLVGHASFDAAFVIKGTDEAKLKRLFDDPVVRQGLERLDGVRLGALDDEGWFGKKFPPATDELQLSLDGLVTDRERLKTAFELFGATLDRLCHMGSAYEDDPGVRL